MKAYVWETAKIGVLARMAGGIIWKFTVLKVKVDRGVVAWNYHEPVATAVSLIENGPDSTIGFLSVSTSRSKYVNGNVIVVVDISTTFGDTMEHKGSTENPDEDFLQVRGFGARSNSAGNSNCSLVVVVGMRVESPLRVI